MKTARRKLVNLSNTYGAIHKWLNAHFDKSRVCEICGLEKKCYFAKKHGKTYERNRDNFWRLCGKCHRKYDDTPQWRDKLSVVAKARPVNPFAGRSHSEAAKQAISMKKIGRKRPDVAVRNRILKTKLLGV